jgi:lysophospholipase L1-like esterase
LHDADIVVSHYEHLLAGLRELGPRVHVLGLIPPDRDRFPGSAEHFAMLNARVRAVAQTRCASFLDWAADVDARRGQETWRYRDGFHPNQAGARLLAEIIRDRLLGDAR